MSTNPGGHIADGVLRGISPRQCHDPDYDLADRPITYSARVTANERKTRFGVTVAESDTHGDDLGWNLWESAGDRIPGWSVSWPSIVTSAGKPSKGPAPGKPAAKKGPGRTRARGAITTKIKPLFEAGLADDLFAESTANLPDWAGGMVKGATGTRGAGTDHLAQKETWHPDWLNALFAVNRAGDPELGTLVYDLKADGSPDPERRAHIQSAWSVFSLPPKGICRGKIEGSGLALQLGAGGRLEPGSPGYGFAIDHDLGLLGILAAGQGSEFGGPLVVNYGICQHNLGKDADGRTIRPVHLPVGDREGVLFQARTGQDGPLRFETELWPKVEQDKGRWRRSHIRYNRTSGPHNAGKCAQGIGRWEVLHKDEFATILPPLETETGGVPTGGLNLVAGVGQTDGFELVNGRPPTNSHSGPRAYIYGSQCGILPGLIFQPGTTKPHEYDTTGTDPEAFTEEEAQQILLGELAGGISSYVKGEGNLTGRGTAAASGQTKGGWSYDTGRMVVASVEAALGDLLGGVYDTTAPATTSGMVFPPGVSSVDFAFPDSAFDSLIRGGVRVQGSTGSEVTFTPYDSSGAVQAGLFGVGPNGLRLQEVAAPGAPGTAGQGHLYASSADSKLYWHPSGGSAVDLTAAGGGSLPSGTAGDFLVNNGSGSWIATQSTFGGLTLADDLICTNATVNGKLTVTGMIDPTGIEFTPQFGTVGPMSGTDRGFWTSTSGFFGTRGVWRDGTDNHAIAYELDWQKQTGAPSADTMCLQLQSEYTGGGFGSVGFGTSLEFRQRHNTTNYYTGVITSELTSTVAPFSTDMVFRTGFETSSLSGSYTELLRLNEKGTGTGLVRIPQGVLGLDARVVPTGTLTQGMLYADSGDGKLYYRNNAATWVDLTAGAGGSVFADDVFRVQDNADATKELAFELSGVTTGTLRTLTIPDASGTISLTSDVIPVATGGTGAITASAARTNLGLAIGSDVQAFNTNLTGINQGLATTDSPTFAALTLTAPLPIGSGGTGAATASAAFNALSPLTTLGDVLYGDASGAGTRLAGNTTATKQFLTQTGTGAVSAAPAWGALAAGDIPDLSATYLAVGTIGVSVQAYSADLDTYAANPLTASELAQLQNIGATTLSAAQFGYLGATGGTIWTIANDGSGSGLDADLLDGQEGTYYLALANATGQLAVANGGTGSATAAGARTNLGLAIGSDVQAYDADLATLAGLGVANSIFRTNAAATAGEWQAHSTLAGNGLKTDAAALALDVNGLSVISGAVDGAADYLPIFDASAGGVVKVLAQDIGGGGGVTDHGALTGLGDDDHSIYPLLSGRAGGQVWQGGLNAGDDIWLISTGHATKGHIICTGDVRPDSDNLYDLGISGARWNDLWFGGVLKNGTLTWTPPSSTGTLALTSDISAGVGLSGGGGSAIDLDVNLLTAEATTDGAADYVAVYDDSAAAMRKVLLGNLPSAGGGGGGVLPQVQGGRLTTSSSESVTTGAAQGETLYLLPHKGREVAIYSGSAWAYQDIGASGISTAASALTENTNYDVFMHGTSPALELLAWTNDTTRVALGTQDAVLVRGSDNTRRFVGSVRAVVKVVDHTAPGMTVGGTMTFAGATGAELIDDQQGSVAGDPGGLNASTEWKVDLGLGNAQVVNRITVAKDPVNGVTNAATMKLEYSDNDSTWTQVGSNFTISAGTSGTPEVFSFTGSSSHRYWRIYYVSGTTLGNFWLQEIELSDGTLVFADQPHRRFVSNADHRVSYEDFSHDTSSLWSNAGNGTYSAINPGQKAWKHEFLNALAGEPWRASVAVWSQIQYIISVALDSEATPLAGATRSMPGAEGLHSAEGAVEPSVGYHYMQGVNTTYSATARTAYAEDGYRSGMSVRGFR